MSKWSFKEGYRRGRKGKTKAHSFIDDLTMSGAERASQRRGFEDGLRDELREQHRRREGHSHREEPSYGYTGGGPIQVKWGPLFTLLFTGALYLFGVFYVAISLLGLLAAFLVPEGEDIVGMGVGFLVMGLMAIALAHFIKKRMK